MTNEAGALSEARFKIAAIQMTSTRDVERNLAAARALLEEAAAAGAKLAVLPENFSFLGAQDSDRLAAAEPPGDGPAQRFLAQAAEELKLWIVGGTVPIRAEPGRAASRSLLFGPDGRLAAQYDKIHLFDVAIPGKESESYRESATTIPGMRVVTAATPFGRVGLTVCYDLRFPALFHRLGALGMDILAVPAAFTVPTGQAHWRALLQARAIENLCYVVAAGQWGEHDGGRLTYGHSMILGPWGEVLAVRESAPGVVCADVDMIELERIRQTFPVLTHRREL
ncbi:MAG TPA: carbon-nitrogen hydrolase family protein [Gammaproteobacteria bacterium]